MQPSAGSLLLLLGRLSCRLGLPSAAPPRIDKTTPQAAKALVSVHASTCGAAICAALPSRWPPGRRRSRTPRTGGGEGGQDSFLVVPGSEGVGAAIACTSSWSPASSVPAVGVAVARRASLPVAQPHKPGIPSSAQVHRLLPLASSGGRLVWCQLQFIAVSKLLTYLRPCTTAVDRRSTPSARADRQEPLPMFRCPGLPGFPLSPVQLITS